MKTEKVLAMKGGQGEGSYAQNSSHQRSALQLIQHFLKECISSMKIAPTERFCAADLGCSCGPNTLFTADLISMAVMDKYMQMGIAPPELQLFFTDLPSNDFNLLFRSLSQKDINYFAAGVSGSFHNRLFPRNSLHFVHSAFSLHWLSQVPAEIEDRNSRSWNGGRVFISKAGPVEVAEAYLRQFQNDFQRFLRARSEEMVGGGCMFLTLSGRPEECEEPRDQGPRSARLDILQDSFNDMVIQGMIEEDKRDSFNIPFFLPTAVELRGEVEKEGSFAVKAINNLSAIGERRSETAGMKNEEIGKYFASNLRAVLEGLISAHFGSEVVSPLFESVAKKVADNPSVATNVHVLQAGQFFVVLTRKEY